MWPAEWRVVCRGGGLPSEAMKRRALEKDGETGMEYIRGDGREIRRVIESCRREHPSDALSVSASEDVSVGCGERLARRRSLAAVRLATAIAQDQVREKI